MNPMLIDQQYYTSRKREIHQSVREATLENAEVICIAHDEAMEKMENWLNVWIHKMKINNKYLVKSIIIMWKPKEISHIIQGQENVKLFFASAGLHVSRGEMCGKMLNFRQDSFHRSGDCRTIFKIRTKCYTNKSLCGRASFQHQWNWVVL